MKFFGREYDNKTKHTVYYIFGIKIQKKDKLEILKTSNSYLTSIINSIGADKIPPATGELREWQLECLELLRSFDRICRENGVKYWLDFGTLLGAFRHRGFIPWDDDIDTSMLYSDIVKIMPILEKEFANSDFIVRKGAMRTKNFQIRIRHKQYNLGIDIFQVYEYPESNFTEELRTELTEKIVKTRKIFENKYHSKFVSKECIKEAIKDIIKLQEKEIIPKNREIPKNPVLFHGIDFPYEENYFVMPNEEIFPLREHEFEGYNFYVPNKAEEYLSNLWRGWQNLPEDVSLGIFEHFVADYKNCKTEYEEE